MKESENFAQWSRFGAVNWMECMDHVAMSGCFGVRLWADCATFLRNVVVQDVVMYLNYKGLLWSGQIPNRSSGLACNESACQTMRMAAATGQSLGLIASQKKGIFSPFCLFFYVCNQMCTEATEANGSVLMSATGISSSKKNLKSSVMKVSGGCKG